MERKSKPAQGNKNRRGIKQAWLNRKNAFWLALGALSIFLAAASLTIVILARDLPSVTELSQRKISQSTKIYDRTGTVLLYEVNAGQNRTVVQLNAIPQHLKDATIATEDENFYNEPAFSWSGIARAILVDILRGHFSQGGSTITQQLAKNAFLSPEQTVWRKIRELILAVELDRRYSKDEILSFYLNEIPYGPNSYGIEAASEIYFNKPVQNLDLAESALLAALPRAPSYYSPWGSHQKELLNRQQYILKRMRQLNKISDPELRTALGEKLDFAPRASGGIRAPHFVEAVEDYVSQKYGDDMLREGGLKILTTLDWNMQQTAEKAVSDGAQRNEELYDGRNAALVAEDPKTGQILAMVGSRDYFDIKNDGNFNVATQGLRQPGSALKPFVYMTLFKKGYSPDTVLFDVPTEFVPNNPLCAVPPDFSNSNPACFHPQNFSGAFSGPVTLRQALAQSINVPAVKVLYLAGLKDSLQTLHNFGITTLNEPDRYGLSLVLGGGEVKLIDLVGAYATFAQDGVRHEQSMVLEIDDSSGNKIETYQDQSQTVVDPQYARLVNDILSDSDARAPLFQSSLNLTVFQDYDVALKTGTTNDYRDAWSMGYTPSLVAGVWAGNNDNTPMQRHAGSILAAVPIWHDFMSQILPNESKDTFAKPSPVAETKPMLDGDYKANGQIHSILYYVDRSDPAGPAPSDPSQDPQFDNWESAVRIWAQNNLPNLATQNQATPIGPQQRSTSASAAPVIQINEPAAGSFVDDNLQVRADISSSSPIKELDVYFNGQKVGGFSGDFGTQYSFSWSFAPPNPALQNLLEIYASDSNNQNSKSGVIVYR